MSWNAALYYYHLSRGGDYFGLPKEGWESSAHAALVLPREKGPIHISPWLDNYGRYGVSWKVAVTCQVELQAPYTLKITGGGAVRRGLNTVLDGLEQGYKMLGGKGELAPDFGAPELAAQRGLKSDNAQFTRWVLQSAELRQGLKKLEKASVRVEPLLPDSTQHMVCVLTDMDSFDVDDVMLEDWKRKSAYEETGVFERLDALVELLETARNAVTAWPMPQTYEGPK